MDFPGLDYNDPESIFRAMGGASNLPIPKTVSPKEVRRQAKAMAKDISGSWKQLNDVLDRHEPAIHRRWAKKSKNQRAEILLAAWPRMSSSHRPDFGAFRRETEQQRDSGTKFRDAYMWPHVNQEDLSKPRILPLFLQSRARNSPDVFAISDENAAHLGYVTKAIVPLFLNQHTMMFTNWKTPDRYGELIAWDDDDRAFEWMTSRKGTLPGSGLLVLEMQQRVLHFLVDCCKRIMHDISAQKLTSEEYAIRAPVQLPPESVDGIASLAVMAVEAPYRAPANTDLARLESLFTAKASAAEDHIWALREDPGYFADGLLEFKEHRQEMIKDRNGKQHPLFRFERTEILWQRVINNVVSMAHLELEIWTELLEQVKELRKLQSKYTNRISVDNDLPEEYLDALLKFQHYLKQSSKGPLGLLKQVAVASPPLRPYFVRMPVDNPASTKIEVHQKPNLKLDKPQTEVIWLLRVLWEDSHELFLAGIVNVVDELGRLIQSEPKAKEMISSFLAYVMGDLTILAEAMRQINMFQPWAQTFEDRPVEKEDMIKRQYAQRTANWGRLMKATDGTDQMKFVKLGAPEAGKFDYPVEKRRTKENVHAMQTAEKNLDAFWVAVDQNLQWNAGHTLNGTALKALLANQRILKRTADWAEPKDISKGEKMEAQVEDITQPLSKLYLDLSHGHGGTTGLKLLQERTASGKVKRKGVTVHPNGYDEAKDVEASPLAMPDRQPTFEVDVRALKVFRTLFYTPSVSATPGDVPWTDFLHAMVSAGFGLEKLYGSVWQFSPTKLDVERSIQFHEPHPVGKLAYRTARRFGRRLERAYGWWGGMFLLREKTTGS